jgi:hypothetical protein
MYVPDGLRRTAILNRWISSGIGPLVVIAGCDCVEEHAWPAGTEIETRPTNPMTWTLHRLQPESRPVKDSRSTRTATRSSQHAVESEYRGDLKQSYHCVSTKLCRRLQRSTSASHRAIEACLNRPVSWPMHRELASVEMNTRRIGDRQTLIGRIGPTCHVEWQREDPPDDQ